MFSVHIIVLEEIATEITWLLSRKRFQKVPFSPSTLTHLAGVFKFVHFGERFQKAPSSVTEDAVLMWTDRKAYPDKKKCVFKFIWLSVDVALTYDCAASKDRNKITGFCIDILPIKYKILKI